MSARRRSSDERGQTTLMILGLVAVLVLIALAVTDLSAVYLRHSRLNTVADGAALAGVDAIDADQVYTSGIGDDPQLSETLARRYVAAYMSGAGVFQRFPGLTYSVSVEGNEIVVSVAWTDDLPVRISGVADRTTVRSTGSAVLEPTG